MKHTEKLQKPRITIAEGVKLKQVNNDTVNTVSRENLEIDTAAWILLMLKTSVPLKKDDLMLLKK